LDEFDDEVTPEELENIAILEEEKRQKDKCSIIAATESIRTWVISSLMPLDDGPPPTFSTPALPDPHPTCQPVKNTRFLFNSHLLIRLCPSQNSFKLSNTALCSQWQSISNNMAIIKKQQRSNC
jgi:hypothetical protein